MNIRKPIFIIVAITSMLFYSCDPTPETHKPLTIVFFTFQNVKPHDINNLYPNDIKEISYPFGLDNNEKSGNLIFDEIRINDQLNNAIVPIGIKSSSDGNIDMNNINGVTDRINAIFSELKIDNALLADSSKIFDYDNFFEFQTPKPNFFIFYTTEPVYPLKYPSYIGVDELRKAIKKILIDNDSISTVFVAYNPSGNKSIEENHTETVLPVLNNAENKPVVNSSTKSDKKKNDRIKAITNTPEIIEQVAQERNKSRRDKVASRRSTSGSASRV